VPKDRPIDGIDASPFLVGKSPTTGRSRMFFGIDRELMSVKWALLTRWSCATAQSPRETGTLPISNARAVTSRARPSGYRLCRPKHRGDITMAHALHNGSVLQVWTQKPSPDGLSEFFMYYDKPSPQMMHLVRPGTLLVDGTANLTNASNNMVYNGGEGSVFSQTLSSVWRMDGHVGPRNPR
jgi:hypothetical protein